jgi:hypothetical protein
VSARINRIIANYCLNILRQRHPQESLNQEESPALPDTGATLLQAPEEQALSRGR